MVQQERSCLTGDGQHFHQLGVFGRLEGEGGIGERFAQLKAVEVDGQAHDGLLAILVSDVGPDHPRDFQGGGIDG